eukprot:12575199-Alexandrium_andersonii.AAC.1
MALCRPMLSSSKRVAGNDSFEVRRWEVMGAWNVRGWGGRYNSSDPFLKSACLFHWIERRG